MLIKRATGNTHSPPLVAIVPSFLNVGRRLSSLRFPHIEYIPTSLQYAAFELSSFRYIVIVVFLLALGYRLHQRNSSIPKPAQFSDSCKESLINPIP